MKVLKMEEMKGGWFVGDFAPTALRTTAFEVSFKVHPKGQLWGWHYHTVCTEVNYLVRGCMTLQGRELAAGDIFTLAPYEIADPVFLEDCEIVCVKTPSAPHDKVEVEVVARECS